MIIDLRPSLRGFLLADPVIAAAVGNARVYPLVLPQGQRLPSVVYSRVTGIGDYHMQGASSLVRVRMQMDAWAPGIDAAATLANLVKFRIDGYRGPMTSEETPPVTVQVQGVFQQMDREDFQADVGLFRVSRDFDIWFAER